MPILIWPLLGNYKWTRVGKEYLKSWNLEKNWTLFFSRIWSWEIECLLGAVLLPPYLIHHPIVLKLWRLPSKIQRVHLCYSVHFRSIDYRVNRTKKFFLRNTTPRLSPLPSILSCFSSILMHFWIQIFLLRTFQAMFCFAWLLGHFPHPKSFGRTAATSRVAAPRYSFPRPRSKQVASCFDLWRQD